MQGIVRLPKPVIASVHGIAIAAGCQLVASCDLAVGADDPRFAAPGVNIGLFCSTPMVALSRNVGHKAAMQMLLTGELIDAPTALRFGLVNEIVAATELTARTATLAQQIATKSPLTLAIGKEAFYRQAELALAGAYAYAARAMTANLQTQDAQEGIGAFLDKHQPVWCGHWSRRRGVSVCDGGLPRMAGRRCRRAASRAPGALNREIITPDRKAAINAIHHMRSNPAP